MQLVINILVVVLLVVLIHKLLKNENKPAPTAVNQQKVTPSVA